MKISSFLRFKLITKNKLVFVITSFTEKRGENTPPQLSILIMLILFVDFEPFIRINIYQLQLPL